MTTERQMALDIARLEQQEASLVWRRAKSVENEILRQHYDMRVAAHMQGLRFAISELTSEIKQLTTFAYKRLSLWLHS